MGGEAHFPMALTNKGHTLLISTLFPAAGVIDRDYRGNVGVVLFNLSKQEFQGMCMSCCSREGGGGGGGGRYGSLKMDLALY